MRVPSHKARRLLAAAMATTAVAFAGSTELWNGPSAASPTSAYCRHHSCHSPSPTATATATATASATPKPSATPTATPTPTPTATPSPTPTPAPTATSTPSPTPPLWSGDFETGNLSQWTLNQSCPTGVVVETNQVRSGNYATKFTVADGDTNAKCSAVPTSDPRAQLVGPGLFTNGTDEYIGFSTFFPADFPTVPSNGLLQFAEIYGPPFGGSPPMGFDVKGNRLALERDPTHNWDTIWTSSADIPKGTSWVDITVHVKFSTDPSVGFIELWLNGVQQTFSNGQKRIYYDTLVPGVNWDGSSANHLYLNEYRSAQVALGTVTLYHDAARVGTTYGSVQP